MLLFRGSGEHVGGLRCGGRLGGCEFVAWAATLCYRCVGRGATATPTGEAECRCCIIVFLGCLVDLEVATADSDFGLLECLTLGTTCRCLEPDSSAICRLLHANIVTDGPLIMMVLCGCGIV